MGVIILPTPTPKNIIELKRDLEVQWNIQKQRVEVLIAQVPVRKKGYNFIKKPSARS